MLKPSSELPSYVRVIRRRIISRTRRLNRERASEAAAATPATETGSKSDDEDDDTGEDYGTVFALNEHICSSDEEYEDSEMDAASKDQLKNSLTSTAEHEGSEIDVAAEHQLQVSLAEEAWKLEVKNETVS